MKIKIHYIDGERLKRSIIASAGRISEMQEKLNSINVFPVADADTGTNMVATMQSIVASAQECQIGTLQEVCASIAEGALTGARGNSGAILAQFFYGLSEGARGKERLSSREFAQAVNTAVKRAREALSNPREGTILTVMQDWADHLKNQAIGEKDFARLFRESLKKARESLAETPKRLQTLRRAGVVDAGAQGFVHLLEGLTDFIDTGKIVAFRARSHVVDRIRHMHFHKVEKELRHRFCTECVISGSDLSRMLVMKSMEKFGDSLIVVGGGHKIRIHIHTNNPDKVFAAAAIFGAVASTKVEDMRRQQQEALGRAAKRPIGLVTDSTCDIPPDLIERHQIEVVPVFINVGGRNFQDRVEISTNDFYQILKNDSQKLTTSQPPVSSFSACYKKVAQKYEAILSIHISEALSGTIQGARLAVRDLKDKVRCEVINSKTTSAALGLIVGEAGRLIESGASLAEVHAGIERAIAQVRFFVSVPTIKYLVRSGRVHKTKGLLATLLQIKPVIGISAEGKAVEVAKVIGRKRVEEKTLELALQYAYRISRPRFSIVHMLAPELGRSFQQAILKRFPQAEIPVLEASPALGLHAGIGSAGIAVLGDPIAS